jgi:hypothetical protein
LPLDLKSIIVYNCSNGDNEMEVTVHPKTEIRKGDLYTVVKVNDNRLDVANLRYVKSAILENNQRLLDACNGLVKYRNRVGALQFQLEKADDFIREIERILIEIKE